jgi:hypothetical protein
LATSALILLTLLLAAPARGADVIPWQDAGKHVGEQAGVEGVVAAVHCSPLACSLAFEPTFTRFTAIIQAAKFDVFPPDQLEGRYRGKPVRVTGTIEAIDGKPRMQIAKPEAIAIVRREASRRDGAKGGEGGAEGARVTGAGRDHLPPRRRSRPPGLLGDRLVARAAYVRSAGPSWQRERSLAAAQMSPGHRPDGPPPGPEPSAPQAAWRSAASSASPALDRVIDSGGGWTTWDYGAGRVITFDNAAGRRPDQAAGSSQRSARTRSTIRGSTSLAVPRSVCSQRAVSSVSYGFTSTSSPPRSWIVIGNCAAG